MRPPFEGSIRRWSCCRIPDMNAKEILEELEPGSAGIEEL
jgi:hypothetical protein